LGVSDKPTVVVFNKIDAYKHVERDADDLTPPGKEHITLEEYQLTWMSKLNARNVAFISATQREHIDALREILYEHIRQIHITRYPHNDFLFEM
jgi:GTP-binding protein HflX